MTRFLVVLIGLFALSLSLAAPAQREPSDDEKERTRIKLGISREQQSQIESIFAESKRQEGEIHMKSREQYGLLFALYESYDFDRDQAKKVRREIGRLNYKRMQIHAETQEKLRKVLSREQFDKMIQHGREMREKWRQGPRRGPRDNSR